MRSSRPVKPQAAFGGALLGLLVVSGPAVRAAPPEPSSGAIAISAEGGISYGSVDGFLQTPNGGAPGTASSRRPTLRELGIDDAVVYEGGLRAQWRHVEIAGGAQFIDLSGSATLSQSLLDHGVAFPAGARVRSDVSLDWYRAGGGWKFALADRRLELTPRIEGALLDFSSALDGAGTRAQRRYAKGALRLGIEGIWHFSLPLSLELNGAASLPLENTPQIATVHGVVQWQPWPQSHCLRPTLFLGAGAEWIDYEDRQQFPNHVHTVLGPLVTGGFILSLWPTDTPGW